ncbi:MAG: DegV family protein [Cellulosilyticum sp.]|nr:DegV family protein [Cellulosilyticum sp.]
MSEIVLLTDSSCDLPLACLEQYHIEIIPYYVSFDATHYYKEITELSISDFYQRLRAEKIFPKTSLPSINDYYEHFKPHVEAGKSVICVTLSNHFSGSHNAALNARELILENYPNAQIEIINSLNATGGEGVLVLEIGRMIQNGLSFETILELIPKVRETARIFFFVETLDYLEHGGRIGKASALLGTMLNVKPIIYLQDGLLFPNGKVRGTKKALAKVLEISKDYVGDEASDYHYLIAHADNVEYATVLKEGLASQLGVSVLEDFCFIGTTIGVYTGPDVAGICLIKKYESFL